MSYAAKTFFNRSLDTNGVAEGSSCAGVDVEALLLGFPVDLDPFPGLLPEVCSLALAAARLSVADLFSCSF